MLILNIAAGKFDPLVMQNEIKLGYPKYILNIDTSYFDKQDALISERNIQMWEKDPDRISYSDHLNMDAFEFMERTKLKFDRVVIYRFLEHISFTQVEYFIYLVSTVLKTGGFVDVIVPNYKLLAQKLLDEENVNESDWQAHNILLTTELLNEPSCPHASIWTPERMKRYWELEGRFKVGIQKQDFNFDGRSIYLRSWIERL